MRKLEELQKKASNIGNYIMVANITGDKGYIAFALRDTRELVEELLEQLK